VIVTRTFRTIFLAIEARKIGTAAANALRAGTVLRSLAFTSAFA